MKNMIGWIVMAMVSIGICSCIDENLEACFTEHSFFISVVETSTGEEITSTGEVGNVDLYIFDRDGKYLQTIHMTKEQVLKKQAVRLSYPEEITEVVITAWGNIGMNEILPEISEKLTFDNSILLIKTKGGEYGVIPDNLFFGMKSLKSIGTDGKIEQNAEEIRIFRKNGRLSVTVKGLPQGKDEDYYFEINQKYNGYTFRGEPVQQNVIIKEKGIFIKTGEYGTETPFNMVHSAEEELSDDNITLSLKNKTGNVVAEAESDREQNKIRFYPGKTTNVLIDLTVESRPEIYMVITPWNEVHQWVEWNG